MPARRWRSSHALPVAILLAILALAAGLRFWALDFGLPHPLARPDEREILLPSWSFARGDLNPRYHVYPGLYLYLVWLWGEAGLALRRLFVPTPPYPTVLLKDIAGAAGGAGGDLLLIGRALSALAGTLTVALVYRVTRRHVDRATGLAAAALLATCFLHVRDSHALKAEALLTLAIVPAIAACARLAVQPTGGRALAAGLWIAIATGMKQPGSLLLIPLYAAGVLASPRAGWRRLLPTAPVVLAVVTAAIVFVATGPYLLLDWRFVWKQMGPSVGTVFAPTGDAHHDRALLYHLTVSLRSGAGLLFALLALPAIAVGLFERNALLFLAAIFSVVWLAVIGASPVHHVRYLTPILPLLAILVARLLARAAAPLGRRAPAALVAATLLISFEPLRASIAHDRILAATDTRVLAGRWLAENTHAGDEVAVLGTAIWTYGIPVMPAGVKARNLRGGDLDLAAARLLVTHEHLLPFSHYDPAELERLRPRLELLAEFSPYAGEPGGWFEAADAYYAPFKDFDAVVRPGPLIRVYSVLPEPSPAADRPGAASTVTTPSSDTNGSAPPS
jgi:4-amino-4-deoxy-L-arabinose transferase-like glycosyltransferase